ncbi:MAG: hypothetical protein V3W34_17700 [Phycisphaerae bacterium]
MDVINRLLINGANALLGLWETVYVFCAALFAGLEALLNPIVSPVLGFLNPMATSLADFTYLALDSMPVWLGLTVLSVLAGVVMLIVFRYTSNQAAIGKVKDDIKANLLALKLYNHDMRVTFQAQGRLFWCILRLQLHMLRPILVMLPPMLLLLGQMGVRYQYRPLHPGERTLIKMKLASTIANPEDVMLQPNPGLIVEAGPVPGGGWVVWRVRGGAPGRYTLSFDVEGSIVEKELVVADGLERVSAVRPSHDWTAQILHPLEPRLPALSPARSIEILYPSRPSMIHGSNWWILTFFVVSMVAAVALKPVFRVRF